jgi:hypothetical protein
MPVETALSFKEFSGKKNREWIFVRVQNLNCILVLILSLSYYLTVFVFVDEYYLTVFVIL